MAVLAKPCKNQIIVDAKSSKDFINRFNKNTITPKMLDSCAKAGRLFVNTMGNNNIKEEAEWIHYSPASSNSIYCFFIILSLS